MMMLLLALAAAALSPCAPTRPAACDSTNALVRSAGFNPRLAAFLRGMRGSYLDRDAPVFDQAVEVLGGPPDEPTRLADGTWLFTACRAHSCPEKGAVALSEPGRMLAFGILAFACHRTSAGVSRCDKGPTLTLFVPRAIARNDTAYTRAMIRWAREGAAANRAGLGADIQAPFRGVTRRVVKTVDTRRRLSQAPLGRTTHTAGQLTAS